MDARTVWTPQTRSCFDSGGRSASTNKRESRDGYSGLSDQSTEPAPSRDRGGLWRGVFEGHLRGAAREGAESSRYQARVMVVKTAFPPIRRGNTAGMG